MRRIKHAAYARLYVQRTAVYALGKEVIPAIFAPFLVGFPRFYEFGAMRPHGMRVDSVHSKQVAKHIGVVVHIVIYSHNYSLRKIGEGRNQLAV